MDELKVGVVGLGWAAGAHIDTFNAVNGAKVAAVCSRRKLKEAELKARFSRPIRVYNEYEDMLADPELDIIDICTPHHLHREQTVAAAEAGKHLLIEKPLAISYDDCKAMRDAARQAGVKSCVCFEVRFSQHFQLLRSVLDQGLIGNVHYAEVDYYHGIGPWYVQFGWNVKKDVAGSSLLTAGCHALDIMLYLLDDEVVEVSCYDCKSRSDIFKPYEYPSTSVTILKFKNGTVGKVASSVDCLQPYYFHAHLLGSEGSLLDNKLYSHKLKGMVKDTWSELQTVLVDSGDVRFHPYEPQFQAFIDAIRADKPMPLTDLDTAFETHRVCFASDRSAREGRPVKLTEFPA